jgi:hypothetical protein
MVRPQAEAAGAVEETLRRIAIGVAVALGEPL